MTELTREMILAEPAGLRMNEWVAEFVMGWEWKKGQVVGRGTLFANEEGWGIPGYSWVNPETLSFSEDIAMAWRVWEKMRSGEVASFYDFVHALAQIIGNGAPEAYVDFLYGINAETICRAALLATLEPE